LIGEGGEPPQEAISKIKEKIDLLGEDSLVKKAGGIKAWKESEVNKLYLELGEESNTIKVNQ